ncbi:hypothetical protein HDU81_000684 [Chytriomyces hyalinus]|nr:hypothetical protein HDU81_000684 [Chytriomyces hyalinus]
MLIHTLILSAWTTLALAAAVFQPAHPQQEPIIPAESDAVDPPILPVSSTKGLIYLIKHGEKSANIEDHNLNPRGQKRAKCLAEKFAAQGWKGGVFCPSYSKNGARIRSCQTVAPLAKAANVALNHNFKVDDVDGIANEMARQARSGAVLMSWQHDYLAEIASTLAGREITYPKGEFDVLWMYNVETGEFVQGRQGC